MTLDEIATHYGAQKVAEVLGVSEKTLSNYRAGRTALTVDDLYQLQVRWPDKINTKATVHEIGMKRVLKQRDRKTRDAGSQRGVYLRDKANT